LDNSQKRPTPQDYYAVFQSDPQGAAILDQLSALFYDCSIFDADPYKHAFNAGKREVLAYIIRQCGLSQQPPLTEGESDE